MDGGVALFSSILDKPLTQLTEEDISQVTREDCRKYLKEKGMRRPSWNKSQAIQQVISLKALLETNEDSGAGALRRILVSKPRPITSNSADSAKEPSENNNSNLPVDETANLTPLDGQPEDADNYNNNEDDKAISSRGPGATDGLVGQMTIFYCGKVNVYDGVPPDKARAIMHLAASPLQSFLDHPIYRPAYASPHHLQTPSDRHVLSSPNAVISLPTPTEGHANRQISFQRYLEKKKDRGRFKGKKYMGPISSLDACLNHQVMPQISNEQSTRSSTSSPPQSGVPHASSNSTDDQPNSSSFSVDLNEDVEER